jgi:hypothetical protein
MDSDKEQVCARPEIEIVCRQAIRASSNRWSKPHRCSPIVPTAAVHVVLITDGVETPGGRVDLNEGLKKLAEARATVHIISYTTFVRQQADKAPTA